jgi:transposase
LLLSQKFPRVWVPTPEERDRRQLLKHRNKLVRIPTSVRNQLHFLAMSPGLCRKRKLWSRQGRAKWEGLSLGPWASPRRKELLELRDGLEPRLEELKQAVKAERRPEAAELMKQKGIGAVIALAYILTLGPVERFPNSRALVRYLGLNPRRAFQGGSSSTRPYQ